MRTSLRIDVAIVGAGVSGALIADAILESGKTVAVFDRRGPAKGSTAASTSLLEFELDTPLTLLSERIGREKAARAYWRSASGVAYLQARIQDLGLRCAFRPRSVVYLPGNILDVAGLKREAAARAAIGLRSRFVESAELRSLAGLSGRGAVVSPGGGELNPVALVAGLWRSASARGARIFSPVNVVDVQNRKSDVLLTTEEGLQIRARHVVFATGYEPLKLVQTKRHKVVSTWVMATARQPQNLWPSRCLIWEAADPYHYLRTTIDGRIVIGGGDEPFSDAEQRDALIPSKVRALERHLKKLFPSVDSAAEFAWAGSFGTTTTGLPSIGSVPGAPRCFAVLGYGGNGITFSAIAAQIIQRALAGIEDPDRDLFAFVG
jgi:glycine/D-amino acid oxidase-like deaminating enzyme